MNRVNKIVKFVILPIFILLVILLAAFCLFGEHILKTGVETAAANALGVGVSIDDVDLSILKGSVGINGLIVENPPDYTHKNLLELSRGRVTANIRSLLGDTVHIKELKLDDIDLVIEQKGLSNNLQEVISSLPAKDKQEGEPETAGKKLHIDKLEITNIKVKVKLLPIPGKVDTVNLNLEPIRMTNLGSDNKLSTGMLAGRIMLAIANGVAKKGTGILPEDLVNTMKSTLSKTVGLGKATTEEGKKIIEAGGELIEGFKGLLKPRKKK